MAFLHYALVHWRFGFFSRFSRIFLTFILAFKSENARKMQEKREKNPKREPNMRKCLYITLCVGQKRRVSCVLLASCLRLARILLAFCSHFACFSSTNVTKTQTQQCIFKTFLEKLNSGNTNELESRIIFQMYQLRMTLFISTQYRKNSQKSRNKWLQNRGYILSVLPCLIIYNLY